MSLDPRPARKDLLTSREVSKILGGVLAGLCSIYGREIVRVALTLEGMPFASHDARRCARLIGSALGGMADMASADAIEDGLKFWVDTPAAINALPDKVTEDGGSN
jgi:hypothetical protein